MLETLALEHECEQQVERIVAIRAIYQDSVRLDPDTLGYARWLAELGGQVRTLPVVPQLMVIVDREVALLPRAPDAPAERPSRVGRGPLSSRDPAGTGA